MTTADENRIALEKSIVKKYVDCVLAAGYLVTVNDGEETVLRDSTNKKQIIAAMFTTDEDVLYMKKQGETKTTFLYFVYGNAPWEVLNDCDVSLKEVIKPADDFARSKEI